MMIVSLLVSSAAVRRRSCTFVIAESVGCEAGLYCGDSTTADLLSGLRAQPSRGFKSRRLRSHQGKRRPSSRKAGGTNARGLI
jgi:hypothetical protein